MAPDAFFYPLLLVALVVICLIIYVWWPILAGPHRHHRLALLSP